VAVSRYVATVHASGVRVELFINDIPMLLLSPEDSSPVTVPVSDLVISGRNTLALLVHPAPIASRASEPWAHDPTASSYVGEGSCRVEFTRFADANSPTSESVGVRLAEVVWEGRVSTNPVLREVVLTLSDQIDPWAWQRATRLSLAESDVRTRITRYLDSLHMMLLWGRVYEFADECEAKLTDAARAYGVSKSELRQGLVDQVVQHSKPPFTLDPFDAEAIDLRSAAGGRLVLCYRNIREEVLEYRDKAGAETFFLPVKVGVLDGELRVLR